ncbi:ATP-binding protein [Alcanivorax sp. 24]|uniref:ATP-binding protein n=1 Tax=Alcanivorax sp. 24 TaxID=2545266 RepID=UPI00105D3F4E|nr:ATP-binding protein [Alcanivorax sp. 24]
MARNLTHPPSAASLVASMRDLGYSLETAIADLIDNSISAGADTIDIVCNAAEAQPLVLILDNGSGMTGEELLSAMRHGTVSPRKVRPPRDLGRFGLGLKTASFSQCRSLTVVSKRNGVLCGAEWNLDHIDAADEWVLSILDEADIQTLPYVERLEGNGTAVIWRELDRLGEDETGNRRDEVISEKLDVLDQHLALVFHRFLAGEIKEHPQITITVNGHAITAFDPFCRRNPATQVLPEEVVYIGDIPVRLQPYVLPHHSRLTAGEYDFYQNRSEFISNQGAYIYRNGRLMAWGDWFRLIPKGEATKLARVQIDFPNSLDESWTIDIKKSRARPPRAVRERLRQIISQVTGRSTTVHRGRGQRLFQDVAAPVWERYADHGGIRYSINGTHPLIQQLLERLDRDGKQSLNVLLDSVSASLPVEMIYSDYSTHPQEVNQLPADGNVIERLRALRAALWGETTGDAELFREVIRSTRLFERHMDIVNQYIDQDFA